MVLFGEKYGDQVCVLSMGGDFFVELCGGIYVFCIGDIGLFKIISEGGVVVGVCCIEVVIGVVVLVYLNGVEEQFKEVVSLVKGSCDNLLDKFGVLLECNCLLEKELEQFKVKVVSVVGDDFLVVVVEIKGVKVFVVCFDGLDGKVLLVLVDQLKNKFGCVVILFGGELDGKVVLVVGVIQDLIG